MLVGVTVSVGVGVSVEVDVGVAVLVDVGVCVGVAVDVGVVVAVAVAVGVWVDVGGRLTATLRANSDVFPLPSVAWAVSIAPTLTPLMPMVKSPLPLAVP